MRTIRFSSVAIAVAMATTVLPVISLKAQNVAAASASASNKDAQLLKIPSPLEEITQLNQSGVGDKVILSYIENADRPYRLNAQDIIKLRDAGVSTEVTAALIQRGAAQRQEAAEAANQKQQVEAQTVAVAPTYQTQPNEVVETAPAPVTYYSVQPVSTVSVTYFGSRGGYGFAPSYYPSYRSYGSSYRCAPSISFGIGYGARFGGYRHGGYRSTARYCR